MAILIDVSQIVIANLMMSPEIRTNGIEPLLIKHMVFNSIRSYKQRLHQEFGQVVICCDSQNTWRKGFFPHYKASRSKSRKDTGLDWKQIYETLDQVVADLRTFFPYKVMKIECSGIGKLDGAEADDIIAVLALELSKTEKVVIISSDKDYGQLQQFSNIEQFSPKEKKFITIDNPKEYLLEHIINGDTSDGIPNILSAGDVFVNGIRQTSIFAKKRDVWITQTPEVFCLDDKMKEAFERNNTLINFEKIPQDIQTKILEQYQTVIPGGNKTTIMNYFIANRMKNLIADLGQF